MPLTPRLRWSTPTAATDPWEDSVQSLFEAIDATSFSYREDRNAVIMGGGTFTFTALTNTIAWDAPIEIFSPVTGFLTTIPATSLNLLDKEVLYCSLVRGITNPVNVTAQKASTVPSDDNGYLLAIRRQDRLYFRYGKVLLDGSPAQVFALNLGGTGSGFSIAGDGLYSSGVTVNVGDGAGINTQSDYVEIDLAPSSGLEFHAPGVAGKLKVLPDPAGAIQLSGSGIAVKPDTVAAGNPTVAVTGNGVRTLGVPINFNINSVATGSTVTSANLNQLTDTSFTTLHAHRDPLTAQLFNMTSGDIISIGDPVSIGTSNSRILKGKADTVTKSIVLGVAVTAAALGDPCNVVTHGMAAGVLTGATVQTAYFLSSSGGLTTTIPATAGHRRILVGWAYNTTDLWVQIQDLGTAP